MTKKMQSSFYALGYIALQTFGVAGLVTREFPDSPTYMSLNFLGHATELPSVPLLYSIFPSNAWRVFAQAVIAGVCWWSLGQTVANRILDRHIALASRITIMALGLVSPVMSWNTTILSESLTLSLTAALVASWITYISKKSASSAVLALVVTLAWTWTRQADVYVGFLITLAGIIAAFIPRHSLLKSAVCVMLLTISGYSLFIVNRNTRVSNGNIGDVIADRILLSPNDTKWFIDHGMPYSPAIAATAGSAYGAQLFNMPSFAPWLTKDGVSTYVKFLLTHPEYTFIEPLRSFFGETPSLTVPNGTTYPSAVQPYPVTAMLSPTIEYGRYREVVPPIIGTVIFEQGQSGTILVISGMALLLLVRSWRRHGADPRQLIPIILVLSVVPHGLFVWLTCGVGELDRLSITLAVSFRIGLFLMIAFACDHLYSAEAAERAIVKQGTHAR